MMRRTLTTKQILTTAALGTLCAVLTPAAQAAVIADFSAEFPAANAGGTGGTGYVGTETFPTGWQYLWVETADLGTASEYMALVPNTFNSTPMWTNVGNVNFNDAGQGDFQSGRVQSNGVHPGIAGVTIVAYTIQAGEAGDISIVNSTLGNDEINNQNGIDFDIYVNDTLQAGFSLDAYLDAPDPVDFDGSLGTLNVGDTIYIAVGNNGNGQRDFTVLDFQLVPEPSSLALMGLGGLLIARRRRD